VNWPTLSHYSSLEPSHRIGTAGIPAGLNQSVYSPLPGWLKIFFFSWENTSLKELHFHILSSVWCSQEKKCTTCYHDWIITLLYYYVIVIYCYHDRVTMLSWLRCHVIMTRLWCYQPQPPPPPPHLPFFNHLFLSLLHYLSNSASISSFSTLTGIVSSTIVSLLFRLTYYTSSLWFPYHCYFILFNLLQIAAL
jgi:hypothetical protein